ncbi:MAG: hypothetical protein COA97_07770 [Flavobacteriales bacterium]|nr:MAG: hypothetical protein COA97_07770 [Flavobacteriales bacterium]
MNGNMSKTLIILAHPKIENSIGNKIISTILLEQENIEIRHLDKLYPDFKIDIKAEQEALLAANTIVFQYPLFWYSTPALLKEWIDQVFQYGFAFGKDSYHLEGKRIIVSFTMGSPKSDYPKEILDKIVFPFQGLAKYCKIEYLGEIYSNDIHEYYEGAKENAIQISNKHSQKLLALIKN